MVQHLCHEPLKEFAIASAVFTILHGDPLWRLPAMQILKRARVEQATRAQHLLWWTNAIEPPPDQRPLNL